MILLTTKLSYLSHIYEITARLKSETGCTNIDRVYGASVIWMRLAKQSWDKNCRRRN